jgi:HPr kinase/phosphorylase
MPRCQVRCPSSGIAVVSTATNAGPQQVHASCVAFDGLGILLRGPSASGKSDLAIRLIEAGASLVADDRVDLAASGGRIVASPPPALAGLMELRGLGLVELPNLAEVPVVLICDLVRPDAVERLPLPGWCEYLGARIRQMPVAPFETTAVAKLRVAVYAVAGRSDPVTGARLRDANDG